MSLVLSFVRKASIKRNTTGKDAVDDDLQLFTRQWRHKPQFLHSTLDHLCTYTRFSRKQIRVMYRAFKDTFPAGCVSEDMLKEYLKSSFPCGDPEEYSNLLFGALDIDKNGTINFIDLIKSFSQMTSESLKTQLDWIFGFYDIDQDDHISHSDMLSYLKALYNLKYVDSSNEKNDHLARKHISFIFEKFHRNPDQKISREEFVRVLELDATVLHSLAACRI